MTSARATLFGRVPLFAVMRQEALGAYTENLTPNVMVMEPAEKHVRPDDSGALNRTRNRMRFSIHTGGRIAR